MVTTFFLNNVLWSQHFLIRSLKLKRNFLKDLPKPFLFQIYFGTLQESTELQWVLFK